MLLLPAVLIAAVVTIGFWLKDAGGDEQKACAGEAECAVLTTEGSADSAETERQDEPQAPAESEEEQARPRIASDDLPPQITAYSAAVLEEPCGAQVYGYNEHLELPPASLTKIMTAVIAAEHADLGDAVTVHVSGGELSATTDATVMGLEPGETLSVKDLLYGLLLPSGNDAAIALAEYVAGDVDTFVQMMNRKAQDLGLRDTQFRNPHGLDDPGHYTSAYDIAMLARVLLRNADLADAVQSETYQPAWDGPAVQNINLLVGLYPGAIGIKTGYTDAAGQTIVAGADRDGRRLIVSVLKSEDLYVDASALLDWAFDSTESACSGAGQALSFSAR